MNDFIYSKNKVDEGKLTSELQAIYHEDCPPVKELHGEGSQYIHAHTFGFHKKCRLNEYPAVYGGLFADALLKGARIKKKAPW